MKATTLNPNAASAHSYLADVRINQGRPSEALESAKRAVLLEPGGSYHHCSLAFALARLAKTDEAIAAANKALTLADKPSDRQRAEQLIAFLKGATK